MALNASITGCCRPECAVRIVATGDLLTEILEFGLGKVHVASKVRDRVPHIVAAGIQNLQLREVAKPRRVRTFSRPIQSFDNDVAAPPQSAAY